MKRCFAALLVAASVAAPTAAQETDSPYAAIQAGVTLIDDATAKSTVTEEYSLDPGFAAGGALGYAFGQLRVEGEALFKSASLDEVTYAPTGLTVDVSGSVSVLGVMANAWYDIDTASPWTPYIGGGAGWARIGAEVKEVDFDESDGVFAYQVGAGIGYSMSESTTVFIEYRYFGSSDPEFERNGVKTTVEIGAHNARLGFRISFQT